MPIDVKVRPLSRSDKPGWMTLWEGYNAFYGRKGDTALPAEIVEMTWGRLFDPYEPIYALVAESDDNLVGLAHYLFHRNFLTFAPTCYLQDLYADPQVRGTGVGRALIEAVYAAADAAGCPSVYWLTQDFNETARRLYDRIAKKSPFIVYRRG